MVHDNIFENITTEYYQFTGSEKKIADFILQNGQKTQYMSISELAEESLVAEATVTRFCKRLGFQRFSGLKLAVANATATQKGNASMPGEITPEDTVTELCKKLCNTNIEAITQTVQLVQPERITQVVDLLEGANTVLCMGQGGSMMVALQAAHLFSTTFPHFYAIWDSHSQVMAISHLKEGDVGLVFSYSGATHELEGILNQIAQRGAKSVLVTRFPKSPGGAKADMVLQCGANETPLQLSSVAAAISQMFLMDLLFHELCRRDFDTAKTKQEKVAEGLLEKHL